MVMDAEYKFQQETLLILTPYYLCNEEQLKHRQGFCCKTHIHANEEKQVTFRVHADMSMKH